MILAAQYVISLPDTAICLFLENYTCTLVVISMFLWPTDHSCSFNACSTLQFSNGTWSSSCKLYWVLFCNVIEIQFCIRKHNNWMLLRIKLHLLEVYLIIHSQFVNWIKYKFTWIELSAGSNDYRGNNTHNTRLDDDCYKEDKTSYSPHIGDASGEKWFFGERFGYQHSTRSEMWSFPFCFLVTKCLWLQH